MKLIDVETEEVESKIVNVPSIYFAWIIQSS